MLRYFEKLIHTFWNYVFQNFNFAAYFISLFDVNTEGDLEIFFFHGMKDLFSA